MPAPIPANKRTTPTDLSAENSMADLNALTWEVQEVTSVSTKAA